MGEEVAATWSLVWYVWTGSLVHNDRTRRKEVLNPLSTWAGRQHKHRKEERVGGGFVLRETNLKRNRNSDE